MTEAPARLEIRPFPPQGGEREFRRLLERLPAGAYTCDPEGLITYFNQRAVEVWGRAPKLNDAEDRFCGSFKLYYPDGSPMRHDQCWMALALQRNEEYNGEEVVIERPDGARVTALAHANPIRDESGILFGAVNVLVDISERKRAEDELRQADQFKDEFLATLAHELRNPLAPIRNAVDILRMRGSLDTELHWASGVIDRQLRQLTRLVDDLLDVARITRGTLELRKERIEVAAVMRAAVETSNPVVQAGGHRLILSVPPEPLFVDADPVRVAQAIANLLNNAATYTGSGGCIWLSAERQGTQAVVTVRDTGMGIPAEMLPRIFDLFMQGDRSLERSKRGLGIGLTLVKRLIEAHSGTVGAHSDGPGTGSEFTIRLPAIGEAREAPCSDPGAARAPSVAARRILVVDDNRDAADTLGMALRSMGNEICTAYDGLRALEVVSEFRPDAVLVDIGMPGTSGYEVARRIRERPQGFEIVLIAVTGWGQPRDVGRSRAAGFNHHFVKPVDVAALMALLAPR